VWENTGQYRVGKGRPIFGGLNMITPILVGTKEMALARLLKMQNMDSYSDP